MLNLAKRINWPFLAAIGICCALWVGVIWRVMGAVNG